VYNIVVDDETKTINACNTAINLTIIISFNNCSRNLMVTKTFLFWPIAITDLQFANNTIHMIGYKPSELRGGKALRWWAVLWWWRGVFDCGSISAEGAESAGVSRDVFVPPRCRGGHKRADWRGGGTAMMAGAVAMERVASDEGSARWLRRGGLVKLPSWLMVDVCASREKWQWEWWRRVCLGVRQQRSR